MRPPRHSYHAPPNSDVVAQAHATGNACPASKPVRLSQSPLGGAISARG
jgi:hypothetical protein